MDKYTNNACTAAGQPPRCGRWINKDWEGLSIFSIQCDQCRDRISTSYHYNYCPNCGKKMTWDWDERG